MENTVIRTSARIHRRMLTFANLYTQHRKSALPPPLPLLPPSVDALPPPLRRLTYPLPFNVVTAPGAPMAPLCCSSCFHSLISFILLLLWQTPLLFTNACTLFCGSPVHS